MLGATRCFGRSLFAAVIFVSLTSLPGDSFKQIAKSRPTYHFRSDNVGDISLHDPRASIGTSDNSALGGQLDSPFTQGNLKPEGSNADPGVFGGSLSAAGATSGQAFPLPFAQDLQKGALEFQGTALYPEVAAVLTPARYSATLYWDISTQLRSNPGVTPIIRARWHTAEQYVAAAAALRDDRGSPFFFVVLAEYAPVRAQSPTQFLRDKGLTLVPATQESLVDEKGRPLPYPFSLPTALQLLQSAFGTEYAVKELATGELPSDAQSLGVSASGRGASDSPTSGSSGRSPRSERNHTRETTSAFLRWIPFGLTRKSSPAEGVGELAVGVRAENGALIEPPENEEFFVESLSRSLPRHWLRAPDGRHLVIVLDDQITECRNLLHLAVNSSSGGTPVFVENSEGLDPRKLLKRLKDERIDGKKIAFVLFALGGSEVMPMNAAFLDRAVLRVPKADDIKSFLKRQEEEAAEELASEKRELEQMQQHMEKRTEHLLEVAGGSTAAKIDEMNMDLKQDSGKSDLLEAYTSSKVEQPPVLVLNPFDEFLLRFNYTEVSDLTSYAEALAMELRNEPLEISIGGDSHRIAVMILSDPPEAETELGPAWVRLNRLIHMAIAISMIVGLLCCLCMWRLMILLKQR